MTLPRNEFHHKVFFSYLPDGNQASGSAKIKHALRNGWRRQARLAHLIFGQYFQTLLHRRRSGLVILYSDFHLNE